MRITNPPPPSRAAQPKNYLEYQNGLTPILDGRHGPMQHLLSPPIEVYHPVFASFIKNARDQSQSPPIEIIRETTKLITSASEICVEEDARREKTRGHLAKILGRPLMQSVNPNRTSADHICIGKNSAALLIVDEKAELGTGNDPSVQVSFSYFEHWKFQKVCMLNTCLRYYVSDSPRRRFTIHVFVLRSS